MADRLIQGQVTRAQEAEDNFVLRREMSSLKKGESEETSLRAAWADAIENVPKLHRFVAAFH